VPVDRTTAARLAEETAATYQRLELELIQGIAGRLADGIAAPDWITKKMLAAGTLRRWADETVRRVAAPSGEQVARSLVAAYGAGGDVALREIAVAQDTHPEWLRLAGIDRAGPRLTEMIDKRRGDLGALLREVNAALPNAGALNRLIVTTVTKIDSTRLPILRRTEDLYRTTIAKVGVPSVLAGAQTRREAAQQVFASLTRGGITGFVDQGGRAWSLPGYVDMATRTATAQAAVEGHLDRLGDAGLDLVIVSNVSGECKLCRPWEGKVLTRGGVAGARTVQRESEIEDEMVAVEVAGNVAEATGAGLLHPNCRHSLSAYLPGLTTPYADTEDPKGDADRQKLRALERRKRDLLRQQAAVSPFNGGKTPPVLAAKLKGVNADIKAHVASNRDLTRQPARERIDLGLKTPKRPFAERIESAAQGDDALAAARFGLDRRPRPEAFTSDMSRAVNTYTGSEYNAINRHLRGQPLPYGYTADDVVPHLKGLDLAMRASRLDRDVLTYRGITNAEPMFGDRVGKDLTGMEWREDAYLSTTASAKKAAGFAGSGGLGRAPVVMRILAPAGTPAIEASGAALESEILLRRGLRLRIVADHGLSPDGVRHVDVEVLG